MRKRKKKVPNIKEVYFNIETDYDSKDTYLTLLYSRDWMKEVWERLEFSVVKWSNHEYLLRYYIKWPLVYYSFKLVFNPDTKKLTIYDKDGWIKFWLDLKVITKLLKNQIDKFKSGKDKRLYTSKSNYEFEAIELYRMRPLTTDVDLSYVYAEDSWGNLIRSKPAPIEYLTRMMRKELKFKLIYRYATALYSELGDDGLYILEQLFPSINSDYMKKFYEYAKSYEGNTDNYIKEELRKLNLIR